VDRAVLRAQGFSDGTLTFAPRSWYGASAPQHGAVSMLTLLIGILITIVIGAICFYLIDKFIRDGRLANLLKILVVLICLASIVQRLWVMTSPGVI
jgi:uncharacterized membrane protein required for colicin V production